MNSKIEEAAEKKNEYLLGFASTQQQQEQRESLLPVDPTRATLPFGVVLVDASADVSSSMRGHARLRLLPLAVRWAGRTVLEKGARSRLRHLSRERLRAAQVAAPGVDSLEYRLYPPLAINADWLIHLGTRREFVDVATPLQQMIDSHAQDIRDMRLQRGLDPGLQLALVDSGSLLCGTALQARMLLQMLQAGIAPAEVARRARSLRDHTRLWLAPQYPADAGEALQRQGHEALGAWQAACARPLRHLWHRSPVLEADSSGLFCDQRLKNWRSAAAAVLAQLTERLRDGPAAGAWVQVSLDGSLRELQAWPEYEALRQQAIASRATLHLTHMSAAGRIWASAGSLGAALYQPPA